MISISQSSWYVKLANYGGLTPKNGRTDLCALLLHAFWGAVRAPMIIAFFGAALSAIIFILFGPLSIMIVAWSLEGLVFWEWHLFEMTYMIWATLLVLTTFFILTESDGPGSDARHIISSALKDWKSKSCTMIDLTP